MSEQGTHRGCRSPPYATLPPPAGQGRGISLPAGSDQRRCLWKPPSGGTRRVAGAKLQRAQSGSSRKCGGNGLCQGRVVFSRKGGGKISTLTLDNAFCPAVTMEQYACTGKSSTNAKKPPLSAVLCAHRVNVWGEQKQG